MSAAPWVVLDGQATQAIITQIEECPSGALSYERVAAKPE